MKQDEAHRLKALESEKPRLKRIVADQALDISMLKELQKETGEPGPETRRGALPGAPPPDLRAPGVPPRGPAALDPALPRPRPPSTSCASSPA